MKYFITRLVTFVSFSSFIFTIGNIAYAAPSIGTPFQPVASTSIPVPIPTPLSGPSIKIVGRPDISISYDWFKKESSIEADYTVFLTAGSQDAIFPDYAGIINFIDQKGATINVNSTQRSFSVISGQLGNNTSSYGAPLHVLSAGKTATLKLTIKADPRQFFSGIYHATLVEFLTIDNANQFNYVSVHVPDNKTASKAVFGEVSPYLYSVSNTMPVKSGDTITVAGSRLFYPISLVIDGNSQAITLSTTRNGSSMSFQLPSLADGAHLISVNNQLTGSSNTLSLQVQNNPSIPTPSITVLSPNGGETLTKGTTNYIRWSGGIYPVQVGVVRATYPTDPTVVGWIQVKANADGTLGWDTDHIGPLDYLISGKSWSIDPGQYKILVVSPTANGNQCFGSSGCVYDVSDSSFTIIPATQTAQPPVISGGAFPTYLTVGQTGTWTINASDPQNGSLSYSVNWGDTRAVSVPSPVKSSIAVIQNSSFTHAYSTPGTYTVVFTVQNASGLSAQSKTTVTVASSSNPTPLATVTIADTFATLGPAVIQNNTIAAYQVNFGFTLFNSGNTDVYISKNGLISLGFVGGLPGLSSANPGVLAGDTATQYVIPAGTGRQFTFTGMLTNPDGTAGLKLFRITKISYGTTPGDVTSSAVTSGLENLFVSVSFGPSSLPSVPVQSGTTTSTTSTLTSAIINAMLNLFGVYTH
jgi:hypothetical protein